MLRAEFEIALRGAESRMGRSDHLLVGTDSGATFSVPIDPVASPPPPPEIFLDMSDSRLSSIFRFSTACTFSTEDVANFVVRGREGAREEEEEEAGVGEGSGTKVILRLARIGRFLADTGATFGGGRDERRVEVVATVEDGRGGLVG